MAEIGYRTRVVRHDGVVGTVSFVRNGFARVLWDDGTHTDEWAANLAVYSGEDR